MTPVMEGKPPSDSGQTTSKPLQEKMTLRRSTASHKGQTHFRRIQAEHTSMASATFSLEDAKRRLDEDGFVHLDDSSIGEQVSDIEQKGFPWVSKYGLDFCWNRVLDDEVSVIMARYDSSLTLSSVSEPLSNPSSGSACSYIVRDTRHALTVSKALGLVAGQLVGALCWFICILKEGKLDITGAHTSTICL